jgi:signal transduction histidine kinase
MRREHLTSWLFVGALFALCAVLGILQYRWIGEVSVAARERLRNTLKFNLEQIRDDFNTEVSAPCRALLPAGVSDAAAAEFQIEQRAEGRPQARQLLKTVALAIPKEDTTTLRVLDWDTNRFAAADWPEAWGPLRARLEARLAGGRGPNLAPRGAQSDLLFETPIFTGPGPFAAPFMRREEIAWVIFELNLPHLRNVILPEVVERRLNAGGALDYEVEVVSRAAPASVVYLSDPAAVNASSNSDGTVSLLDLRLFDGGRGGRGGRGRGMGGGAGAGLDNGRWEMFVRHRAGSLEAVVSRARWRNLAVTAGVLLLLVVTLGALLRFTQNAQRLARLQMDFVAGVSHELRTPLTALYTAGHNLRGRVAQQPSQVERYGEMIQQEAGRLKDLVEQVLRFASANAGRIIQEPAPTEIGKLIEELVEASQPMLHTAHCAVDTVVAPDLPLVMADPLALKQALQNLLTNAVKHGARGGCWVGITASRAGDAAHPEVEIRVSDRGPGIPKDEQARIFDAFYRGRRASQEQIHGAGLGLNLVKKIVEAHGGSIRLQSEPDKGAHFIVRLPAAPESASA